MKKNILVIKPNSLLPTDKDKLEKEGNIVIESENEIKRLGTIEDVVYEKVFCCSCGDPITLTKERLNALRKSKRIFYCPQGHQQAFSTGND